MNSPPSLEEYQRRLNEGLGYWYSMEVICHLCANRMKPSRDWYSVLDLSFVCCESCQNMVEQAAIDIFGKYRVVEILNIDPSSIIAFKNITWINEESSIIQKDLEQFIESDEYIAFSNAVKALCIWHKPEIKL